MQVLNLDKISKLKRRNLIHDLCGGAYDHREAVNLGGIGVGGLKYLDGAQKVDEIKRRDYLRANSEVLRKGLGFYLRDEEGNYMLLIQESEILSIQFFKEEDEIKKKEGFSLFQKSINRNIPYHYAKILLLEDEMINVYPPKLKIIINGLDEINFECIKLNPLKIKEHFETSPFADKFESNYNTFRYVYNS